jgi:hypothetical protein
MPISVRARKKNWLKIRQTALGRGMADRGNQIAVGLWLIEREDDKFRKVERVGDDITRMADAVMPHGHGVPSGS